ncbi:hypothetical protein ESP47_15555 [Heyndrickxia coagulans]|nr:hypothetical protein CIW84_16225 [Heyndrickxia coagulans]AWP35822.1 hypothetical protein CYJ15_01800 [Heyndrickxia coagulans]KGB30271.1 hypothetical protein IE89_05870 [Heyndrickxia coagulans]KXT19181.1 hypothetical protein UZ35_16545 [Heyndrickxia coagulans]OZV94811.1 hypothetical protein CAY57_12410 [Heyndrickxia coagulans]
MSFTREGAQSRQKLCIEMSFHARIHDKRHQVSPGNDLQTMMKRKDPGLAESAKSRTGKDPKGFAEL